MHPGLMPVPLGEVLAFAVAFGLLLTADGQDAIGNFDLDIVLGNAGQFGRDGQLLVAVVDLKSPSRQREWTPGRTLLSCPRVSFMHCPLNLIRQTGQMGGQPGKQLLLGSVGGEVANQPTLSSVSPKLFQVRLIIHHGVTAVVGRET